MALGKPGSNITPRVALALVIGSFSQVACALSPEERVAEAMAGAERSCFKVADRQDATVAQVENSALYKHCLAVKVEEIRRNAAERAEYARKLAEQPPTALDSAYLGAKRTLGLESQAQLDAREKAEHAARVKQAQDALKVRAVERSRELKRERGHGITKREFYLLSREVFSEHGLTVDISDADIAAASDEPLGAKKRP